MLAARKLIRDFQPVEEPGDKCSITGEHEALHHKGTGQAKRDDVNAYWDVVRKRQPNLALLSKGERLCALSVVKRFAHEAVSELSPEGRFPSTSSISSAPFRAAVLRQWDILQDQVSQYLIALEDVFEKVFRQDREAPYFHQSSHNGETLHPEHFPYLNNIRLGDDNRWLLKFLSLDGDFLYREGIQPAALQEYAGVNQLPTPDAVRDVQDKLQKLYRAAEDRKIQPPSNYLALLSMDGDRMGEQAKRFLKASDHTKFSQRLADFASNEVILIVEAETSGRLVYAGGDDVLALIPAEYALSVADSLRAKFADEFRAEGLHASTGIAFVHRTHPLQAAVIAAKTAQERAKTEFGRNAVSAALLQRSGEPLYMGVRWDVVSNEIDQTTQQAPKYSVMKVIETIADAMASNVISRSLPYDVEHVAYAFAHNNTTPAPRKKEFERMSKRRYQGSDESYKSDKNYGIDLCRAVIVIGEYGVLDQHGNADPAAGWGNLMGWLRLARFLAAEEVQRVAVP
jgi:CRISPR-associated protein Cmr2